MGERKTITPLDRRTHLGIKAFVNDNLASFQPNRAKDVRLRSEPSARDPEQIVEVVEFDVKLQMLLDDVLDWDWSSISTPLACANCASRASASRSMVSSAM